MAKVSLKNFNWKSLIAVVVSVVLGIALGTGAGITITSTSDGDVVIETDSKIELAETQVEATIVNEAGEEITAELPTVEAVDGGEIEECGEDEECGRGWYVDTSSPEAFKAATIGTCVDTDGHYGSQCWDLGNLFWQNYAGRNLSTCGTGAAKGTLNCYEYNAGSEFEMIWDATQLQPGDWVIFTNGTYGHIGMSMGYYNDGYISLLGTNQGGLSCSGGGSTANIINISLKNFGGAFRPKDYIVAEPEVSEIPITGCLEWNVAKGDTMLGIGLSCENVLMSMEQVTEYAKQWYSRNYKPNQSVYEGWNSESGVGLYAGDWIDHRF